MWELREELDYIGYRLDHNHATVRRIAKLGVGKDQDDLWEWDRLSSARAFTTQLLDRTKSTYIEAVNATSAQFANDQAIRYESAFLRHTQSIRGEIANVDRPLVFAALAV